MRVLSGILAVGLASMATGATAADNKARPVAVQSEKPRDIGVGDPLRATLLDALRPTIEKDLGQKVKFVVRTLRKQNQWAYVVAVPQKPDGKRIDFSKTRYADYIAEGTFDSEDIYALLENAGETWRVRDFVIGPTDVYYSGWPSEFGAPYPLFKLPVPDG